MLIEGRTLGPTQQVECDVCIIGAGPAGLTLALDLARSGRQVVLVESGGHTANADVQDLSNPASFPEHRHAPMDIATRRGWGGTSALWGGRCLPLDPVDFEERPARGDARWPFDHAELARYYEKACHFAVCGDAKFSVTETFGAEASALVPGFIDGDITASSLERWSLPTRFGAVYEKEARESPNLQAFLGLTCVGFDRAADGQCVDGIIARSLEGVELRVWARAVVIAAGGLESTRLLMNADVGRGGIGNHSEKLGRYYMGHISGKIAEVHFSTPPQQTIFGFERDHQGVYCRRRFVVSAPMQRERDLLNCAMWLDNPSLPNAAHGNGILSMAFLALTMPVLSRFLAPEAIRRAAVAHPSRSSIWSHLGNILADLPATAAFVPSFLYRRYFAYRKVPGFFLPSRSNRYALHYHAEQAPAHSSSVRLSEAHDALGMRRLDIDFRFCDADALSVIETHQLFDQQLQSTGLGRLQYLEQDLLDAINRQACDGIHQIGTTRMSARPEDGVVDEQCRIHGMKNLYVLSSSVFPTSGQANPTLTLIALAVRLSEHLQRRTGTE